MIVKMDSRPTIGYTRVKEISELNPDHLIMLEVRHPSSDGGWLTSYQVLIALDAINLWDQQLASNFKYSHTHRAYDAEYLRAIYNRWCCDSVIHDDNDVD